MKGNYKIVVNTAAGRRRYLQYLIPFVVSNELVDRYDLWVNTTDKLDICFLEEMSKKYPKINLIWQPDGVINGVLSIDAFYRYCCDDDTIYIKLDDDIIWLEPNFFEELVAFRIANPSYFMVSPLVINNDISTYILQSKGLIQFKEYFEAKSYNLIWYNGYFAEELHKWFIDNYLKTNRYAELHCGHHEVALNRYAINAVAWFGKDFSAFGGEVVGDDEEFLTVIHPSKINRIHCFDCNTIAVHFSFSMQRRILDSTNILSVYKDIIEKGLTQNKQLRLIYNEARAVSSYVDESKNEILKKTLPHSYVQVVKPVKYRMLKEILSSILHINRTYFELLYRIYIQIRKAKRIYIVNGNDPKSN